jgi:hypothetical protein
MRIWIQKFKLKNICRGMEKELIILHGNENEWKQ